MSSRQQSNLAAAIRQAEAGIPIFPAKIFRRDDSERWSKKPFITGWQNKATTHKEIIRGWWSQFPDAVPAISLADVSLVAIDVDQHESADGISAFTALIDGHDLPVGPVTHTASGGLHYIFRQPETGERLGNGKGELPRGVDVRGDGGFIVAAGAVRSDGLTYSSDENAPEFAEAYSRDQIPVLPKFLEEVIRAGRTQTAAPKTLKADQKIPSRRDESRHMPTAYWKAAPKNSRTHRRVSATTG